MSEIPATLDHMLAAWNEADPEKIRGHLDTALAPEIIFADPDNFVKGIDAFEAMVREFRKKIPNAKSERTSGFNLQNNRYRYNWLVSAGDHPLMPGMDVTEINDDGLVVRVDGFFGPIPKLDAD